MDVNPGVTVAWAELLAHRPAEQRDAILTRFVEAGVAPELLRAVLADGGDALYSAAAGHRPGWAVPFGGPLAVALLAAEISALAAHLNSRAAVVRATAVESLLDDYSAVTVAARLGVSRQKVYDICRSGTSDVPYLTRVPWRQP